MPTYEYTCRACGESLEAFQQFTDDPLTTCPACGGELRKVFRSVGIVFKGSGFYKTDSRGSSSATKPAPSESSSSSPSTDSGSSSTPASPAPSTPSTSTPPAVPAS
jgi:putative FmdB family regulatory protein